MSIFKKTLFIIAFVLLSGLFVNNAEASFSVSPPVIDESGFPGDAIVDDIIITNKQDRRIRLFVMVNNVSLEEEDGIEEFEIKRGLESSESLANWVSITRAPLEIEAGETKEIPITVSIDPRAKEGTYHAYVFFGEGSRRSDAENSISRDRATLLSINVGDDSEDILQLLEFSPESSYISGSPVSFNVELENRGDTVLTPEGELIVYNRQGREMGSVAFNKEGESIEPEEKRNFTVTWEGDLDWGRQRTRLALSYGAGGVINDTLFFNVLPIIPLVLIFFTLLALVILFIHYLHKAQEKKYATQKAYRPRRSHLEEEDEHTINLR